MHAAQGGYLEVDDDHEDGDSGHQLHDVGQAAAIEGLFQGADLCTTARKAHSLLV